MIRFLALAGAVAIVLAGVMHRGATAPSRKVAAAISVEPVAPSAVADAAGSPKTASRRAQIARIVAETAAVTADRTARRVLAEKAGLQQTALR